MGLTRKEQILAGKDLTPLTRGESYLKAAIEKGLTEPSGGGSGSALPDYSGANDGDVLAIESGEPSWASPASGLPDYSGASDGDVLTLDNGEPTWAAPSGGGLVVNVITTGGAVTLDKTYAEIVPFAPNVWFKEEIEGVNMYGILVAIGYADDTYMVSTYSPLDSTPSRTFVASSEDGVLTTT